MTFAEWEVVRERSRWIPVNVGYVVVHALTGSVGVDFLNLVADQERRRLERLRMSVHEADHGETIVSVRDSVIGVNVVERANPETGTGLAWRSLGAACENKLLSRKLELRLVEERCAGRVRWVKVDGTGIVVFRREVPVVASGKLLIVDGDVVLAGVGSSVVGSRWVLSGRVLGEVNALDVWLEVAVPNERGR